MFLLTFLNLSEKILIFGERLEELGTTLLPYSFFAYIFFRIFFYIIRFDFSINNLVKSIWYLAHGIMILTNDISVDQMVTFIAFIEGVDLFIKHLEQQRKFKQKQASK